MNKGIVYTVTNNKDGKKYVGVTTKSLEERKKEHIKNSKKGKTYEFQNAIGTYGADAFKWEQIDTANSTDELAQKEKDYILKYDAKDNGYNSDSGGGIQKTVYQFDLLGNLVNTYSSLLSAGNAVNATKSAIGQSCCGVTKTCKGYVWSYLSSFPVILKDDRKKGVQQFTKNNEFVREFESITEASRITNCNKTSIAKVCRGERKTSGGFLWKYN
jgi:group I intron endonuclease